MSPEALTGEGLKTISACAGSWRDAVRRDLEDGVIAVWHDESHLNKYVIGRHPLVLSPEYLFPETLDFNQKNLMAIKPKVKMIVKDKSLQKHGGHAWLRQQI